MSSGRINKYIWIIDTITRHGTISRSELSRLWQQSSQGDGNPIPHRTFFSYRRRIEDELGVSIKCNRAHEYYIDSAETIRDMAYRDWLLDAANMQGVLHDNRDISRRIHIGAVGTSVSVGCAQCHQIFPSPVFFLRFICACSPGQ